MKWWTFCHENQASLSWNENQFHDYSAVRFSPHPYEINRLLSYKCHQMTWAFNPIKLKNSAIIDDQDWFTGKKKGTSFDLIASESNEHSLICSKVCGALQQNTLERSGKSTEEEEEKTDGTSMRFWGCCWGHWYEQHSEQIGQKVILFILWQN